MDRIAVGIVLYNPDFERLNKSIKQLSLQFSKIILFNNGGVSKNYCLNLEKDNNIDILGNGENKGIAFALNEIMNNAYQNNYEWVLTLDQDSLVPSNLVEEFSKYFYSDDIAIICPQSIDFRRKYMKIINEPVVEEVKMCITSGSCTNTSIWKKIGGFDSWLFIDLVDNDYCKRVILNNFKILKINSVILDHQFGNLTPRNKFIELFFVWLGNKLKNENISKLSFKRRVSPMRMYYENRNVIYLNKKFKQYGGIGYENHHCNSYFGFLFLFSFYSLLVGQNKIKIFFAIFNGIKDGIESEAIEWQKGVN